MQRHEALLNHPVHIGVPELITINRICCFVGVYCRRIQSVFHWDYTEKVEENISIEASAICGVLMKQMYTMRIAPV